MGSNTREFKQLQDKYYERLAEDGFSDIEDTSSDARLLKSWHSFKFQGVDPINAEAIRDYYMAAEAVLHLRKFKNSTERRIWELHCEGLTSEQIEHKIRKYKQSMIRKIIADIAKEIIKS
jgi:hypothetical protein